MLNLVEPALKYQVSYLRAVEEMAKDDPYLPDSYSPQDLPGKIKEWKKLSTDEVSYRFWLVDGENYLGTLRLRREPFGYDTEPKSHIHYSISPFERRKGYGKLILKLGLEEARTLGFGKMVITCKETNIGSKKIIEANGGKFVESKLIQGRIEPITILQYEIGL